MWTIVELFSSIKTSKLKILVKILVVVDLGRPAFAHNAKQIDLLDVEEDNQI